MSAEYAVETINLWRIYKDKDREVVALRDVNIKVKKGELFGILGPNGAGKTTLIRILTTLLLPTKGDAFVHGYNVKTEDHKIRSIINLVSGGEYGGYGLLRVEENLWMFAQFYGISTSEAKRRIKELAEKIGFENKLKDFVRNLSLGERQKMNIIRGFLTDPLVIFLDEPTLGLDVPTAKTIRNFIKSWLKESSDRTVLLTTHYMLEAEELCDRIAIIDKGRIVAIGSVEELRKMARNYVSAMIEFYGTSPPAGIPGVKGMDLKEISPKHYKGKIVGEEENDVIEFLEAIIKSGGKLKYFELQKPSLEDVFISLVGRGLENEE
ncbi:MAG TPA: ABC transporter ATP-binding protein [Euryarchaeota archaeon]|nr:ABC transporter ATP-binding protein [Euryarchaeota archaeon]